MHQSPSQAGLTDRFSEVTTWANWTKHNEKRSIFTVIKMVTEMVTYMANIWWTVAVKTDIKYTIN